MKLAGDHIRIHERELQEQMFEVLGFTKEETETQFGLLVSF